MPEDARKCIASWRKFLPDFEIIEWNEDNFDINICPYVRQAYDAQKYAFVSDYARFWVLYNYGGVYFDTDVEVIKPLNHILKNGPFMAIEKSSATEDPENCALIGVAPGLGLAANAGNELIKNLIDIYNSLDFNPDRDGTIVSITTRLLFDLGLQNINKIQKIADFTIYPAEYFCPMDHTTGLTTITDKTVSIHHYTASWVDHNTWSYYIHLFKNFCYRMIGKKAMDRIIKFFK